MKKEKKQNRIADKEPALEIDSSFAGVPVIDEVSSVTISDGSLGDVSPKLQEAVKKSGIMPKLADTTGLGTGLGANSINLQDAIKFTGKIPGIESLSGLGIGLGADAMKMQNAIKFAGKIPGIESLSGWGIGLGAEAIKMQDAIKFAGKIPGIESHSGWGIGLGAGVEAHLKQISKKDLSTQIQNLDFQDDLVKVKRQLNQEITSLKSDNNDLKTNLSDTLARIAQLEKTIATKEKIEHILPRIRKEAKQLLLESQTFADKFENASDVKSVVVSIDIRRSTELMLKARTPQKYAEFITKLSQRLADAIIHNFGIFDKFTGDGILAFFPEFFSGADAMLYALRAAKQCHEIFRNHYHSSRDTFNILIKDVGLGIGIDYGQVSLVNYTSEFTVVGIPVVYACRMAGAKAGHTLLNQPALEYVKNKYDLYVQVTETEIDIKHEGVAIAYEVELNERSLPKPELPQWLTPENPELLEDV